MVKKALAILLVCATLTLFAACTEKHDFAAPYAPTDTSAAATPPASPSPDGSATPAQEEPSPEPEPVKDEKELAYDAYTLFAERLTVQEGSDSQYDIDMNIKMDMTLDGESIGTSDVDANIKMIVSGETTQYSMTMDMGELGAMEMYTDGDKTYYAINGVEQEIDMAQMEAQISSSVSIAGFEKDAIKTTTTETIGTDTKTTIEIDGKAISGFVMDALVDQLKALGGEAEVAISDVVVTIMSDAAGTPKAMGMEFEMIMTIDGAELIMNAGYDFTFNKFGSGVEIDFSKLAA